MSYKANKKKTVACVTHKTPVRCHSVVCRGWLCTRLFVITMKEEQDDGEYIDSSDNGDTEPINRHMSTERFIEAIKNNPAIWDPTSRDYGNRLQKTKSWERICAKVMPSYSNMNASEKSKSVLKLQRRWKSLRSCYCRERKKKRSQRNSSDASFHKEYLYFSQMSFLNSIHRGFKFEPPPNSTPQVTKKVIPIVSMEVTPHDEASSQKSDEDDAKEMVHDHDLNFIHSLLPHFKKVPDEYKLDLQSEILEKLKKYVNYNWAKNNNKKSHQYGHYSNNPSAAVETDSDFNFEEE
ncbi:hypothetical protein O3G_MSEX005997 [Manduca sexta]|uniref:MADF domain-containing protein n=1 Tax=Manduca sexta TaxID=7130 RepID=A0A921Z2U8_MANSE|nr:hypothetical protein O3G_MSEX005997 [Manduca sexta]